MDFVKSIGQVGEDVLGGISGGSVGSPTGFSGLGSDLSNVGSTGVGDLTGAWNFFTQPANQQQSAPLTGGPGTAGYQPVASSPNQQMPAPPDQPSPFMQFLRKVAPLISLGVGIPQMLEQRQIYNKLAHPASQFVKIPPQVQQSLYQNVEGALAPSQGSSTPGLVARDLATADYQWENQYMQNAYNSLQSAAAMLGTNIPNLLAMLTGGLSGNYTNFNGASAPNLGTAQNADPASAMNALGTPGGNPYTSAMFTP